MKPPVIIIGAGRSGTKLTRDILCLHPELATWPCDEINPIWRRGQARRPDDALQPEDAVPRVKKYLRSRFEKLSQTENGARVVEKTCANCLRVEYVREIFPEALFIHLIRDGRDVAASSRYRWRAGVDLSYTLSKARFTPLLDVPYYSWQFFSNQLSRLLDPDGRLRVWGPRFPGMEELGKSKSLLQLCGIQWMKCVQASFRGLDELPPGSVFEVRYEALVTDPAKVFAELFDFVGLTMTEEIRSQLPHRVSPSNIGKWRRQLSEAELPELLQEIGATLHELGYS